MLKVNENHFSVILRQVGHDTLWKWRKQPNQHRPQRVSRASSIHHISSADWLMFTLVDTGLAQRKPNPQPCIHIQSSNQSRYWIKPLQATVLPCNTDERYNHGTRNTSANANRSPSRQTLRLGCSVCSSGRHFGSSRRCYFNKHSCFSHNNKLFWPNRTRARQALGKYDNSPRFASSLPWDSTRISFQGLCF